MSEVVIGAKTPHGYRRPNYVSNPETNRDRPTQKELDAWLIWPKGKRTARYCGAKIWRKAREGKL